MAVHIVDGFAILYVLHDSSYTFSEVDMVSKCKQCGYCCKVNVVSLNLKTDREQFELMQMKSTFIKNVHYAGKIWVVLAGQCIHLLGPTTDTGLYYCAKYEDRPAVCKEFPKKNMVLWKKIHPECGYCE